MVRILTYIYVVIEVAILLQIQNGGKLEYLPTLDVLKIIEIIVFVPIVLILARRTRKLMGK